MIYTDSKNTDGRTGSLGVDDGSPGSDDEPDRLRVKGSSLNSKLRFVRQAFGAEAEKALTAFLARSGVHQVLDGSWYPFELYDALLRLIAEGHYGSDLSRLREVGIYSAESSLKTTYEVYTLRDFAYFLERLSTLHSRFYSMGELEAEVDVEAGRCRIRLHGAPNYSDPDLHVACGFYIGAARVMDLSEVSCDFRKTDSEVHFVLAWRS